MAGKPIATIGSMHVCPMTTGTVPHVGGPIIGPGASNVLINGVPVALMGDSCTCVGTPDTIAQGEATVLINGTPVVTQGCMTAHGGSITVGDPTVTISSASGSTATMAPDSIPFPDISFISKVLASIVGQGESLAEAQQNQGELRSEAANNEGDPVVNADWKEKGIEYKYIDWAKINLLHFVFYTDNHYNGYYHAKFYFEGNHKIYKLRLDIVKINDKYKLCGVVSIKMIKKEDYNRSYNQDKMQEKGGYFFDSI